MITPSTIDYLCAFSCSPSVAPEAISSAHFLVKETSFRVEDISKTDRVKVKIDAVDGYDLSIKLLFFLVIALTMNEYNKQWCLG